MLSDAAKALSQMLSPPLRAVLWKSIALALVLIIVVAIVLDRLLIWMVGWLTASLEPGLGSAAHLSVNAIAWLLSVVAALGILAGSVLLMPAVTALVASFFADQIADEVEREFIRRIRPASPCRCRARSSRVAKPRCSRLWSTSVPCRSCCLPAPAQWSSFLPPHGCSAANTSNSPRCAFARPKKPELFAGSTGQQSIWVDY